MLASKSGFTTIIKAGFLLLMLFKRFAAVQADAFSVPLMSDLPFTNGSFAAE